MGTPNQYKIVDTRVRSKLEKFASWFHQDYDLFFSDFRDGAAAYLAALPPDRRTVLYRELSDFLAANSELPPSKMRELWRALGAQAWQSNLEIAPTLRQFLNSIK